MPIFAESYHVIPQPTQIQHFCGLLHRIGFAVGLNKLMSKEDGVEEVWHALEMSHTVFGKMVLQEWGLDEEIQDVVAHYGQIVLNGEIIYTRQRSW